MKKIIDVRLRPPVGSYLKLGMYRDKATTAEMGRTFPLAPSVVKESLELLLQEMESVGDYIGCVTGVRRGAGEVGKVEISSLQAVSQRSLSGSAELTSAPPESLR